MTPRLRVLVVDDERLARAQLKRLLGAHPELEVVGEAVDVDSAQAQIRTLAPDVLFLDVQMPRASGFELIERLETAPRVIFVTAHDAHAVRAFEVNALDYLLKPVSPARLAAAVKKLLATPVEPSRPAEELRLLTLDDRLLLTLNRRPTFVRVNDLACVTAADDYAELHTRAGASALVNQPLASWEKRLPEAHFVRVHRSALVNLDALESLEVSADGFEARVQGRQQPLAVSRRCAETLRHRFR